MVTEEPVQPAQDMEVTVQLEAMEFRVACMAGGMAPWGRRFTASAFTADYPPFMADSEGFMADYPVSAAMDYPLFTDLAAAMGYLPLTAEATDCTLLTGFWV